MAATFWWDRRHLGHKKSANGDPKQAIKGLAGKLDGEDKPKNRSSSIRGFFTQRFRGVLIPDGHCLFMYGSIGDLEDSFDDDNKEGIEGFVSFTDNLDVRFVRTKESITKTVAIIGVAGRRSYWADIPLAKSVESAQKAEAWAPLDYCAVPTTGNRNWDPESRRHFAAIGLTELRDRAVLRAKGESAWF